MTDKLRDGILEQVADQYRVVAHLARALADVHSQLESIFREGISVGLNEMCGSRSAAIMEMLGDILNGMGANDEADEWVNPIFKRAHELWPTALADRGWTRATDKLNERAR